MEVGRGPSPANCCWLAALVSSSHGAGIGDAGNMGVISRKSTEGSEF